MTPNTIAEKLDIISKALVLGFAATDRTLTNIRFGDQVLTGREIENEIQQAITALANLAAQLSDAPDVPTLKLECMNLPNLYGAGYMDIVCSVINHLAAAGHLRPTEAGALSANNTPVSAKNEPELALRDLEKVRTSIQHKVNGWTIPDVEWSQCLAILNSLLAAQAGEA